MWAFNGIFHSHQCMASKLAYVDSFYKTSVFKKLLHECIMHLVYM